MTVFLFIRQRWEYFQNATPNAEVSGNTNVQFRYHWRLARRSGEYVPRCELVDYQ